MSALYLRKLATMFVRFDIDRDGALTLKDCEEIAEKLVKKGNLSVERGIKFKSQIAEVWDMFFKIHVKDDLLKKDAFLEAAKKTWKNEDFLALARNIYSFFFFSIDADEDGVISEQEYIRFFDVLSIDEHIAKISFQAIDTDHDGKLSLDEYIGAGIDYFTSDDENSLNRFFWGALEK